MSSAAEREIAQAIRCLEHPESLDDVAFLHQPFSEAAGRLLSRPRAGRRVMRSLDVRLAGALDYESAEERAAYREFAEQLGIAYDVRLPTAELERGLDAIERGEAVERAFAAAEESFEGLLQEDDEDELYAEFRRYLP